MDELGPAFWRAQALLEKYPDIYYTKLASRVRSSDPSIKIGDRTFEHWSYLRRKDEPNQIKALRHYRGYYKDYRLEMGVLPPGLRKTNPDKSDPVKLDSGPVKLNSGESNLDKSNPGKPNPGEGDKVKGEAVKGAVSVSDIIGSLSALSAVDLLELNMALSAEMRSRFDGIVGTKEEEVVKKALAALDGVGIKVSLV